MTKKILALGLISLFSSFVFAESETSTSASSESDYEKFKNNEFSSLFFTIGYRTIKNFVKHEETSSAGSFVALDDEVRIINDSLEFGVMKEFFDAHRLSLSIFATAGADSGRSKDNVNDFDYSDSLSGNFYSYGASLNLNFNAFDMKVQPYVSAGLLNSNSTYVLKYKNEDDTGSSTKIKYQRTSVDSIAGFGLRFIDPFTQLASYISISKFSNVSLKNTTKASVGGNSIDLTKDAKFSSETDYLVHIGMAFFY